MIPATTIPSIRMGWWMRYISRECLPAAAKRLVMGGDRAGESAAADALWVEVGPRSQPPQEHQAEPGYERFIVNRIKSCWMNAQPRQPDRARRPGHHKTQCQHDHTGDEVIFLQRKKSGARQMERPIRCRIPKRMYPSPITCQVTS